VASQALPVFAIAPLLVIWLGFGMASKIVMATLIIFFPIASSFLDGLRRTDPQLLDLAVISRASRFDTLALIRFPSALPGLASGLRVAAAVAPIGAVVGEWVGASAGLGFVMLQANARVQTDVLFAALFLLALMALAIRALVDGLARRMVPWIEETEA
jgi:putative hydroxymethylpyrimidine transport system permease protein